MASFFQRKSTPVPQSENPYWMSFSDMMSGMLIIFILICIALLYTLSQLEKTVMENIDDLRESTRVRSVILREIRDRLNELGIAVEITDNDSVLRIPESSFHFKTGSYTITPELQPAAEKIGQVLYTTISQDRRWEYLDTVFVEGHTDSRDAPEYRKGNWELSAMRAISLWEFWISQPEYGEAMKNLKSREGDSGKTRYLFSVSGYAATRRVDEEEATEEGLRRNRRIDIRFTTRQPTIMDMEKAIEPIRGKE